MSTPKPASDPQAALAEIFRRLAERGRRVRAAEATAKAAEAGHQDQAPEPAAASGGSKNA